MTWILTMVSIIFFEDILYMLYKTDIKVKSKNM